MSEFLLFTLYAPLASWGEIAVGETRGSWDRPSRSAVLGLLAAALGITRDQQAEHDALDVAYALAVRLDAPGAPLVDYHTAQTVTTSVAKRKGARTRAQLLAAGEPYTILSRRAYRQDALATAALWVRADAERRLAELEVPLRPLTELEAALRTPKFTLYAGRKSNVLGLPLAPEILTAPSMGEAFRRRAAICGVRADAPAEARAAVERVLAALRPTGGWQTEVAYDVRDGAASGLRPHRRELRRDAAPHRGRWLFSERVVEIGLLSESAEEENAP